VTEHVVRTHITNKPLPHHHHHHNHLPLLAPNHAIGVKNPITKQLAEQAVKEVSLPTPSQRLLVPCLRRALHREQFVEYLDKVGEVPFQNVLHIHWVTDARQSAAAGNVHAHNRAVLPCGTVVSCTQRQSESNPTISLSRPSPSPNHTDACNARLQRGEPQRWGIDTGTHIAGTSDKRHITAVRAAPKQSVPSGERRT